MTAKPEPGRRERNRLETRQGLRVAGLALMSERGFDDVSVEQIAAVAHVSRATFFNYFDSKVALVFDANPGESQVWRELLAARQEGEPLWTSVSNVVLAHGEATAAALETQMRLKKGSERLALSSREAQTDFWRELTAWVQARCPHDPMTAALIMNSALGVLTTAYDIWSPEQDVGVFLALAARGFDMLAGVVGPASNG